jgi:hypothetical protein
MSVYDENGNLIQEDGDLPELASPAPREVNVKIQDSTTTNKAKVDNDGNLQVKVTDMPPITVNAEGIVVNVENTVEITNDEGNPIPVNGTIDINNFPTNQDVNITNTTLTVDVNNLSFPAVQEVDGTVNVGNFPTTQAVSIAENVNVSIVNEPTVTISNQPTELSINNLPLTTTNPAVKITNADGEVLNVSGNVQVDNFPTQFDVNVVNPTTEVSVSNFPTEVAINNLPTNQSVTVTNTSLDVNLLNQQTNVTVDNFPTSFEVSNQPTSIEVSNFPTSFDVNVTNQVTEVSVSNQPTEIAVNNFPSSFEVSNLLSAEEIAQAQKEWLEKRYTIYDDVPTFYADSVKPQPDAFGRDGAHFKNDWTNGTSHLTQVNFPTYTQQQLDTAKKKINWYFYDPQIQPVTTYANFKNAWALVTMDRNKTPFFYIYGTSNGTTPTSAWVFSGHTTQIEVGKTYLIWFGTEEPTVFPEYQRIQLSYTAGASYGTRNPNEAILSIAYTSNSSDAQNTTEFQTYFLGFKTINSNRFVKLGIKSQNATSVIGSVEITNDQGNAIPVSGNVSVSGGVNVNNFPTNQTVTVDGIADVNISNSQLNVEVLNNPTTISVDNFPTTQDVNVTNTGFDANITNQVLTVDGDVSVITIPPIEIADNQTIGVNGTVDANITNTNLDVTVSNFPTSTEVSNIVSVTGTVDVGNLAFPEVQDVNVTNQITSIEVSNFPTEVAINNLPETQNVNVENTNLNVTLTNTDPITVDVNNLAFPEIQTIDGTVSIDDSTPVDVNITNSLTITPPENQNVTVTNTNPIVVSGTVRIDSSVGNEVEIRNDSNNPIPISNNINNALYTKVTNLSVEPIYIDNKTVGGHPNPLLINGQVEIASNQSVNIGTMPNVTIANPVTSVSVNSLPAIGITNTGFEVTNQPTVKINSTDNTVKVDTSANPINVTSAGGVKVFNDITHPIYTEINNSIGNPIGVSGSIQLVDKTDPTHIAKVDSNGSLNTKITNDVASAVPTTFTNTSIEVSNTPTVKLDSTQNSIKIESGQSVNIGTMPNVTIANPQTTVEVTSLPAITIQNTGFNVNNTPNVKLDATGNTVKIDAGQSVNVGNSPTVKIDSTDNTVKIAASQSVGISGTANVSFNSVAQPVNATITGAGTSAATPLYMVIVGSIDGGVVE